MNISIRNWKLNPLSAAGRVFSLASYSTPNVVRCSGATPAAVFWRSRVEPMGEEWGNTTVTGRQIRILYYSNIDKLNVGSLCQSRRFN